MENCKILKEMRENMRKFHYILLLCVCFLATACNKQLHSLRVCNFTSQHIYVQSINGVNCSETDKAIFLHNAGYAPEQSCQHSSIQNLQITFPLVIQWKSSEDNFKKIRTAKISSYKAFISEGHDIHWDLVLYKNEWKALQQRYSEDLAYSTLMVMYEVMGIPLPKGCRQQSMLNLLEGDYHIIEAGENAPKVFNSAKSPH